MIKELLAGFKSWGHAPAKVTRTLQAELVRRWFESPEAVNQFVEILKNQFVGVKNYEVLKRWVEGQEYLDGDYITDHFVAVMRAARHAGYANLPEHQDTLRYYYESCIDFWNAHGERNKDKALKFLHRAATLMVSIVRQVESGEIARAKIGRGVRNPLE